MSYDAIQKGVYEALTGDATLMALITGVLDHVPQGQAFPYVVIGDDDHEDWDTDDAFGLDSTLTVDVWGRAHRGRKTVKEIQAEVRRILHHQTLALDGLDHVVGVCELAESFLDADGLSHHGVQRFRFLTRET